MQRKLAKYVLNLLYNIYLLSKAKKDTYIIVPFFQNNDNKIVKIVLEAQNILGYVVSRQNLRNI